MAIIVNNVTDPSRLLTTSNSVNTDSRMQEKLSNLFTNHMCWEFTTGLIIRRFYSIVTSSHLLVNHIHFKIFYDNILQQYNSIKTTTQYITICNSNILLKHTTEAAGTGIFVALTATACLFLTTLGELGLAVGFPFTICLVKADSAGGWR